MAGKKAPVAVSVAPVASDDGDLFGMLAEDAGTKKKSGGAKAAKSTMLLTDSESSQLGSYVEAIEIRDRAVEKEKVFGPAVKAFMFAKYTEQMWMTKSKPSNPVICTFLDAAKTTPYHSATYMVKAMFRPNNVVPKPENRDPSKDANAYLREALAMGEHPLTPAQINDFILNEIIFEKSMNIEFGFLLKGHYEESKFVQATDEEKAVGNKIAAMLRATNAADFAKIGFLTAEERKIAIMVEDAVIKLRDAPGILNRLCTYVTNIHQLRHLINVIKPDMALAQVKFAENAPATDNPYLTAAINVLGMNIKDIFKKFRTTFASWLAADGYDVEGPLIV